MYRRLVMDMRSYDPVHVGGGVSVAGEDRGASVYFYEDRERGFFYIICSGYPADGQFCSVPETRSNAIEHATEWTADGFFPPSYAHYA